MRCLLCHILIKFCCDPLVLWITSQFWWWFVDCLFLSFSIFSWHYGTNNPIIKSLWGEKLIFSVVMGGHHDIVTSDPECENIHVTQRQHETWRRLVASFVRFCFASGDVLLSPSTSPKIPKRKNEVVECEGFKGHKKIKRSLRKRIDRRKHFEASLGSLRFYEQYCWLLYSTWKLQNP